MKRALYLILLVGCVLISCKKDDEINISQLDGKWSVVYDDPNLVVDGSVNYQFNADQTCVKTVYNALSDESVIFNWTYVLSHDKTLITMYDETDIYTEQYEIVKLDKREMKWVNASPGDGNDEKVKLAKN